MKHTAIPNTVFHRRGILPNGFVDIPTDWLDTVFNTPNSVLLETSPQIRPGARSYLFTNPTHVVTLTRETTVADFFRTLEDWQQRGYYLAGFLSYEAGYLLENHLPDPPGDLLGWFGAFPTVRTLDHRELRPVPETPPPGDVAVEHLQFSISDSTYRQAIDHIRERIGNGEVYQLNFTAPFTFTLNGSPQDFYHLLKRQQPVAYHAVIHLPGRLILSFSPELFFAIEGNRITTMPMKGTHPRGRTLAEDDAFRRHLQRDPKSQAENVMIVDLLRNDLGRICEAGSVTVRELFSVERYPTVLQMVSRIEGTLRTGTRLEEIFHALFPCGSVTGAPKIRAMQHLHHLEPLPRGVYTGAIGFLTPGGNARFSVAIRTIELQGNQGKLGVGGGIVWDSRPQAEYQECLLKARFLTHRQPEFQLLETLRWEKSKYPLLELHLQRLDETAHYFLFPFHRDALAEALHQASEDFLPDRVYRVRLLLDRQGHWRIEARLLTATGFSGNTIALATERISSTDPFVFHKTTHRPLFDAYWKYAAEHRLADVIFLNEKGEITQGAITNIFLRIKGQWVTPPVESGVLNGVFRRHFLATHTVETRRLFPKDLQTADAVFVGNALRGLHPVNWDGRVVSAK